MYSENITFLASTTRQVTHAKSRSALNSYTLVSSIKISRAEFYKKIITKPGNSVQTLILPHGVHLIKT